MGADRTFEDQRKYVGKLFRHTRDAVTGDITRRVALGSAAHLTSLRRHPKLVENDIDQKVLFTRNFLSRFGAEKSYLFDADRTFTLFASCSFGHKQASCVLTTATKRSTVVDIVRKCNKNIFWKVQIGLCCSNGTMYVDRQTRLYEWMTAPIK